MGIAVENDGESLESNCSIIEKIPPKGVSFSDFIATFAMSDQSFACFLFATLRKVKLLTWQNPEQLFVAQVLKKFNL